MKLIWKEVHSRYLSYFIFNPVHIKNNLTKLEVINEQHFRAFIGKLLLIVILFLFAGCSGTQRFANKDSESKYENNENGNFSILENIEGVASYYADEFHGRETSNGETYDMYAMTAAHKNYPFNTKVRVTNLTNYKSVVLRINDRMPGYKERIIDVSFQAAKELDMIKSGTANVKVEVLKWGE